MVGKILFTLCALATLNQVCPNPLSREINPQSRKPSFADILSQAGSLNIPEIFSEYLLNSQQETVFNLADYLSQSNPQIAEILNIFNNGFGARLLVQNDDAVQVDPREFERLASKMAGTVARTLYPKDIFRQLMVYGGLQTEIKRVLVKVKPEIQQKRVPVEEFTSLISRRKSGIVKRETTDFFTSLINTIQLQVCNSFVSAVYTQVNSSLTLAQSFLATVTIDPTNQIVALLASIFDSIVDQLQSLLEYLRSLTETLASNICGDLLNGNSTSSRRRRDVEFLGDRGLQRDTALAQSMTREIDVWGMVSGVVDLVWRLFSGFINSALKVYVNDTISLVQVTVDSFLNGTVADFLNNIIDSFF